MFRSLCFRAILLLAMAASLPAQRIAGRPATKGIPAPGVRLGRQAAVIERWNRMEPEQRRKALEKLPPERRQRIEDQLNYYASLSPEEQQRLRFRWEMFNQLPPERQDEARRLFRVFTQFPPDRQDRLREEFNSLRALSEADRRTRVDSEDFRGAYSVREQRVLRAFSSLLTPAP